MGTPHQHDSAVLSDSVSLLSPSSLLDSIPTSTSVFDSSYLLSIHAFCHPCLFAPTWTLTISADRDWRLLLIDTYLAFPVQTPYREMQTNPDPLFSPEHVHHSLYIDPMGTLPIFSPNSGQNFN